MKTSDAEKFSTMWILALLVLSLGGVGVSAVGGGGGGTLPDGGKIWAVLVAGMEGWDSYPFQAGVCHAYQVDVKFVVDNNRVYPTDNTPLINF